ncbi:MAG: hypothetical protein FWG02_08060, partial [Holophagaceae bacterium]|nr:hypothetical protein [Holophagaceae bacterium]
MALTGIAAVGTVGCSGGSNTPDKKPDPKPQPTPQQLEEARRLAEFNRLSAPVNENKTIIEVKQMSDFEKGTGFSYSDYNHSAKGYNFAVSATVTDQTLKAQLEKETERMNNFILSYLWEHEFRHGAIIKYMLTIKEPKNRWKSEFLNKTSAYLASTILFRKNMLEEYAKQLELAGGNPNQVQFSSRSYLLENGIVFNPALIQMIPWWDTKNNFPELISFVSQDEASLLVSSGFDRFYNLFDSSDTYKSMNNVFKNTTFISCSYDTDEFFMKAVNAFFTYKIGDKDVNLFELMTPADREAFLTKLNTKMQLEYD